MSVTAQILSQRSLRIPGKLQVTEYLFKVPLDHAHPSGPSLHLFARGVTKAEGVASANSKLTPPTWLTFFQGGPGFGCRAPLAGSWIDAAIDAGYRVLLLDHRGTGLSSAITPKTLGYGSKALYDQQQHSHPLSPIAAQAAYLRHFRAPSIVADAEAVRRALAVAEGADPSRKWSVIGQSFGGFCVVHYLSQFPEGLKEAFTMGGLPPLVGHPDQVYSRLVQRWMKRTEEYYAKFPEDKQRVLDIAEHLHTENIRTPSGGRLSVDRLRGIGLELGFHGGFDRMHNLILRMSLDLDTHSELSEVTIDEFERLGPEYDQAILYALLHEPCYTQGEAANWAAERAMAAVPDFGVPASLPLDDLAIDSSGEVVPDPSVPPLQFVAEAITRSVFKDYPALQQYQELAEHLAQSSEWTQLYDVAKLKQNEVPLYAASYFDDQYVDFDLAQQTARTIRNCKVWITNAAYHDGLRSKGDEVITHLMDLRDDVMD